MLKQRAALIALAACTAGTSRVFCRQQRCPGLREANATLPHPKPLPTRLAGAATPWAQSMAPDRCIRAACCRSGDREGQVHAICSLWTPRTHARHAVSACALHPPCCSACTAPVAALSMLFAVRGLVAPASAPAAGSMSVKADSGATLEARGRQPGTWSRAAARGWGAAAGACAAIAAAGGRPTGRSPQRCPGPATASVWLTGSAAG